MRDHRQTPQALVAGASHKCTKHQLNLHKLESTVLRTMFVLSKFLYEGCIVVLSLRCSGFINCWKCNYRLKISDINGMFKRQSFESVKVGFHIQDRDMCSNRGRRGIPAITPFISLSVICIWRFQKRKKIGCCTSVERFWITMLMFCFQKKHTTDLENLYPRLRFHSFSLLYIEK